MKILNLYAGIGGNRKLWGNDHEITAVEYDLPTATFYKKEFPQDNVVVADAHKYLLEHYKDFDVIWSSPPCPTHSNARYWSSKGGMYDVVYPDMTLYQEIIFLDHFFEGKYIVENVEPYYTPLIPAKKIGRHLFWTNFRTGSFEAQSNYIHLGKDKKKVEKKLGFDISKTKIKNKTKALRNCVDPDLGMYILNCAMDIITKQDADQLTFEWK